MSDGETWTIARVLAWASDDFKKRGLASPRLDAEVLLAHALGSTRVALVVDSSRELSPEDLARYRALIVRRRGHEPVAYLVGRREFFGREFRVDRRVLVPRPDTECLVEVAFERTRARSMYGRALDLCTGSGCVAITFALGRPTWRVLACDLSPDALAVARDNALRLGAAWTVRFGSGDLFQAVPQGARFELITANPPYVPSGDIAALDADVRDHEPRVALDGGDDGLVLVRRIARAARGHLVPGGVLALELQYDQAARVEQLLAQGGFTDIQRRRDYGGHERVVSGVLSE